MKTLILILALVAPAIASAATYQIALLDDGTYYAEAGETVKFALDFDLYTEEYDGETETCIEDADGGLCISGDRALFTALHEVDEADIPSPAKFYRPQPAQEVDAGKVKSVKEPKVKPKPEPTSAPVAALGAVVGATGLAGVALWLRSRGGSSA